MHFSGIVAIAIGASCGALLRWYLAIQLNPLHQRIAVGTLAANLLGGLLIGAILFHATRDPEWSPVVRLGLVTGMLGSLTTFSTFSHETVALIADRHYVWAAAEMLLHVGGSLAATGAGIFAARALV